MATATERVKLIVDGAAGSAVAMLRDVDAAETKLLRTTREASAAYTVTTARMDALADAQQRGSTSALELRHSHQAAAAAARDVAGGVGALNAKLVSLGQAKQHAAAVTAEVQRMGTVLTAAGSIGAAGVAASVKLYSNLESAIAAAGARANSSAADLRGLSDTAIKLGNDQRLAQLTATDLANGMVVLAQNGATSQEMMGGLAEATALGAVALRIEMEPAAQLASDTMKTFSVAAGEMPAAIDKIVASSLKGGVSAQQMSEYLKMAGSAAKSMRRPLDETLGTVALLSDGLLRGSDSGTAYKTMLLAMVPSSEDAADAMQRYLGSSHAFFDQSGRMKSMASIAEMLKTKIGSLSQEQQTLALKTIFGADAYRAATALMLAGADGVNRYTEATNRAGAASKLAADQNNTLSGKWEGLKSSVESTATAIGQDWAPAARLAVDAASTLFGLLTDTDSILAGTTRSLIVEGLAVGGLAGVYLKGSASLQTYRLMRLQLAQAQAAGAAPLAEDTAGMGANAGAANGAAAGTTREAAAKVGATTAETAHAAATGADSVALGANTVAADAVATAATAEATTKSGASTAEVAHTGAVGRDTVALGANALAAEGAAAAAGAEATARAAATTATAANTTALGANAVASGGAKSAMAAFSAGSGPAIIAIGAVVLAVDALSAAWRRTKRAIDEAEQSQRDYAAAAVNAAQAGYLNDAGAREAKWLKDNMPSRWERLWATPAKQKQIEEWDRRNEAFAPGNYSQNPSAAGKTSIKDQLAPPPVATGSGGATGGSGKSAADAAAEALRKEQEGTRRYIDWRKAQLEEVNALLSQGGSLTPAQVSIVTKAREGLRAAWAEDTAGYCARFVSQVAGQAGLKTWADADASALIDNMVGQGYRAKGEPVPGDILAWRRPPGRGGSEQSHVAYYLGDGMVAENTSSTGRGKRIDGGKRLTPLSEMPGGYMVLRPWAANPDPDQLRARKSWLEAEIPRAEMVYAQREGNGGVVAAQQAAQAAKDDAQRRAQEDDVRLASLQAGVRAANSGDLSVLSDLGVVDPGAANDEIRRLEEAKAAREGGAASYALRADRAERDKGASEEAARKAKEQAIAAAEATSAAASAQLDLARSDADLAREKRNDTRLSAAEVARINDLQEKAWRAELALAELRGEGQQAELRVARERNDLAREALVAEREAKREAEERRRRNAMERAENSAREADLALRDAKLAKASRATLDALQAKADYSRLAVGAEKARQGDVVGAHEVRTGVAEDIARRGKDRDRGLVDAIIGGDSGRIQDILQLGHRVSGTAPNSATDSLDATLLKLSRPELGTFLQRLVDALNKRDEAMLRTLLRGLTR